MHVSLEQQIWVYWQRWKTVGRPKFDVDLIERFPRDLKGLPKRRRRICLQDSLFSAREGVELSFSLLVGRGD